MGQRFDGPDLCGDTTECNGLQYVLPRKLATRAPSVGVLTTKIQDRRDPNLQFSRRIHP